MGACHETNADRPRFIINEDFRIKQELLIAMQNYTPCSQQPQYQQQEFYLKRPYHFNNYNNYNYNNYYSKMNKSPRNPSNENKIISKNRNTLADVYKIEGRLGEGGYGQVYLVRHKKMDLLRAMKVIPVNSQYEEGKTDEEIELLKQLDHPNIVKLFEYFSDNDRYYLITEYCKGGDLFELIKKKKKFSEFCAAYIMYQIFRALIYCHYTHHLIHRDIKPENIVVYRQNYSQQELYDVKLIDFGISEIFNKLESHNDYKIKGSINYIAPEVLKHKYNEKCDIWSCGVILYILVVGKYPFTGKDKNEILNNIEHGNYTFPEGFIENSSSDIRDLIQKCLQVNPSKRISAKKAINHPFFKSNDSEKFFIHVTESFISKTIDNVKKYKVKNSLQELTFKYLVHNYPNQEEITLIYRVFNQSNLNNDGKLTKSELEKGLLKYLFKGKNNDDKKIAENETNAIFSVLDGNNNGYIECEEFVRAGIDKKLLKNKKSLKFTFDFLDKDRNGQISVGELKEVFGIVNAEDEKAMVELMNSIDTDSDGHISFDEFYGMMLKIIDGLI